jgi:hypothetical protein
LLDALGNCHDDCCDNQRRIVAAARRRPDAAFSLSCASPRSLHQQGMPLHAQIAFPAAVHRTAAVAADCYEHAHEQIDKSAMYAVCRAVAAGTYACGRGRIAGFGRTIASGCRECIHGLLTNLKAMLPYRLLCLLAIVRTNPAETVGCCHARNNRCGAIEHL